MMERAVNRIRSSIEDILQDRKLAVRILTVFLILLAAVVLRIHGSGKSDITVEKAVDDTAAAEEVSKKIYVDIGGAVARPGVYQTDSTTRLFEIIEMAGGLRSDADTDSINQASFVEDGQKIIIPVKRNDQDKSGGDVDEDDDDLDDSQISFGSPAQPGLVNINTATKEELTTLTGIGDVIAERIIEYRTGHRFRSVEEIRSVKGIGESKYEKIRDSITV